MLLITLKYQNQFNTKNNQTSTSQKLTLMLRSALSLLCSTKKQIPKAVKMINIKVQYEGSIIPYSFPIHTKLAKNLQKARVPLQFQCGFGCSCGTCAVIFSKEDYEKVIKDQPIGEKEMKVLKEKTEMENIRLSCQLFIYDYFQGMTLRIQ